MLVYFLSQGLGTTGKELRGFGTLSVVVFAVILFLLATKIRSLCNDWDVLCAAEREATGLGPAPSRSSEKTPAQEVPAHLASPIPRPIELRRDMIKLLPNGTVVVILGGVFAVLSPMLAQPPDLRTFLLLLGLAVAIGTEQYFRHRNLAREGGVVIARVTQQRSWRSSWDDDHCVYYEFETPQGKKIRDSFQDTSRCLYEGMQFPVFYSIARPKSNLPVEAAWFRVKRG